MEEEEGSNLPTDNTIATLKERVLYFCLEFSRTSGQFPASLDTFLESAERVYNWVKEK